MGDVIVADFSKRKFGNPIYKKQPESDSKAFLRLIKVIAPSLANGGVRELENCNLSYSEVEELCEIARQETGIPIFCHSVDVATLADPFGLNHYLYVNNEKLEDLLF